LKRVLLNKDFVDWNYDTSFIALNEEELLGSIKFTEEASQLQSALLAISDTWLKLNSSAGPWGAKDNFRLNTDALEKVTISHNEEN
jgi:hypothetical protein